MTNATPPGTPEFQAAVVATFRDLRGEADDFGELDPGGLELAGLLGCVAGAKGGVGFFQGVGTGGGGGLRR